MTSDPLQAELQEALALRGQGRSQEALDRASALIDRYPDSADAHTLAGALNAGLGRLDRALVGYDAALERQPGHVGAHFGRGNTLVELGRPDEAIAGFDEAIRLQPEFANAHNNRGTVLAGLQRFDEALASFEQAIRLRPDYAEAHNNRGNVLARLKRAGEALDSFAQTIRLRPDYANAYSNQGNALKELGRFDEALASYDRAVALQPAHAEALFNRGNALVELKRPDEALASYDRAIGLRLDYADAWFNRGNALSDLKQPDDALASFEQTIRLQPDNPEAHTSRANVLVGLNRLDEAVASLERAIRIAPGHTRALNQLLHQRAYMCDWSAAEAGRQSSRVGIDGDAVPPFTMLARDDDPENHLLRAQAWAARKCGGIRGHVFEPRPRSSKIRIGYFAPTFHDHATMTLLARMFELHDKTKFEIHAFSFGIHPTDAMRLRLLGAVDAFHDICRLSDEAAASLAREKAIDIAVDLNGFTLEGRSAIFAHRAAPVQMNYLGYPGSMGADFIDYIIADPVVIPEGAERFYAEEVIRLPHTYMGNDDRREISPRIFTRTELGLPDDGLVFCCFNNNYKISPVEFAIWMRLLGQVEGSVLWLMKCNRWAETNLRREAEARGIDPRRLVFAEKVSLPDHLARHRHADLFLDTFIYNAHTTASDALWAGVPLVTRLGGSFPARVAASLLHAIGLPELVTETAAAYERLALALATDPVRLAAIKAKLAANRLTTPLFDSLRFTRDIERAYERAYDRYMTGLQLPDKR